MSGTSKLLLGIVTVGFGLLLPDLAAAAPPAVNPAVDAINQEGAEMIRTFDPGQPPQSGAQSALRILIMMTVLSLLPALVMTMTSFTRIVIVFSFLRQALGIQGMPPTQITVGMSLFLTMFIMAPVAERMNEEAIAPLVDNQITVVEALERGKQPLSNFMLAQVGDEDLRLFYDISGRPRPATREAVDFVVLVPAFILSEVRLAFQMGFLVLIPFMVIDLIVGSVLMSMGMMMLPPTLIALPIKVMLFVLADGWSLLISSLVRSFVT